MSTQIFFIFLELRYFCQIILCVLYPNSTAHYDHIGIFCICPVLWLCVGFIFTAYEAFKRFSLFQTYNIPQKHLFSIVTYLY